MHAPHRSCRALRWPALVTVMLLPATICAQAVTVNYGDLRPNERIRFTSNDAGTVMREAARFLRPGIDTLFIQRDRIIGEWGVPTHALRNLSVARGSSAWPVAAFFGMLVGVPLGAVIGGAGCYAFECGLNVWTASILLGAAAGGAIGFKLGYGPHDRWVPVVLPLTVVR